MTFHQTLTRERWQSFSLQRRVLLIGSELKRMEHWLQRGDHEAAQSAAERALELLDLSVVTATPGAQRREFCRLRELVAGVYANPSSALEDVQTLRQTLTGNL